VFKAMVLKRVWGEVQRLENAMKTQLPFRTIAKTIKHRFSIEMRLFRISLICLLACQKLLGETFGEWVYDNNNNQAIITSYIGTNSSVVIPNAINGIPVIAIESRTSTSSNSVGGVNPIFGASNNPITSITIQDGISRIGFRSFYNCTNLITINLPQSITEIASGAFSNCRNLASITIPNSVTNIGVGAFWYCSSLSNISISSSLKKIENTTFVGCGSLTNIFIPSSVTNIGAHAFGACSGLTNLIIPENVQQIDDYAFNVCNNLKKVFFMGNAPNVGTNLFAGSMPQIYYLPNKQGWQSTFDGLPTYEYGGHFLTITCNASMGTLSIPNQTYYSAGTAASFSAFAKKGYIFSSWSGAENTTNNPLSISMETDKTISANFVDDVRDTDGDGLTNFQEAIIYGTNLDLKDSNGDGVEDGQAVSMGYNPTINFGALIAHPPTGLYTANQMQAMAMGNLVLNKNSNGTFTLNYDIEQSSDLQTWTPYQALSLPLTGLPTNKSFVRIKLKNSQ